MMMMITAKMNMLGNDSNDIPDRARSGGWWTLLGNPHHLRVLNNPNSLLGACCHYDKFPTTAILCSATPPIMVMMSNMVKIVK